MEGSFHVLREVARMAPSTRIRIIILSAFLASLIAGLLLGRAAGYVDAAGETSPAPHGVSA